MKIAEIQRYTLQFKRPAGTSRGVLQTKETYLLQIYEENRRGIGECAIFRGLSADDRPGYEEQLVWLRENIQQPEEVLRQELRAWPSILFGWEQALANLRYGETVYFPSKFIEGKDFIKINGLIWMGSLDFMKEQISAKIKEGYRCLKLKIGSRWAEEKRILEELRQHFSAETLELRVDANGAFTLEEAKPVLDSLAKLQIHSIEQPIKKAINPDAWKSMQLLCAETPVPIALDEELIGIVDFNEKEKLLETIRPQFIILKPALVGGFSGTDEWITLAEKKGIGWWITSALESNIGLNAIAQYTYTKSVRMPQGLGTGSLFTNNFDSPLALTGDQLWYKG